MNSNNKAQQGIKTFILTLVISLIVFSAIYYIVNSEPDAYSDTFVSDSSVIESQTEDAGTSTLGASSNRELADNTSQEGAESEEQESVFEELATDKMYIEEPAVLAETDDTTTTTETPTTTEEETQEETPESTVPDTGISGPTFGILMTLVAASLFGYLMFIGPRKIALSKFEKDILDDLD